MNSKPVELKQNQAVNDDLELVLNIEEVEQLAKFLDALLEADLSSRSNEGNGDDWHGQNSSTVSQTPSVAW